MSDEYTPTTANVRNCYVYADPHDGTFRRAAEAEFDRWLADVRAKAWAEGYGSDEDVHTPRANPYRGKGADHE